MSFVIWVSWVTNNNSEDAPIRALSDEAASPSGAAELTPNNPPVDAGFLNDSFLLCHFVGGSIGAADITCRVTLGRGFEAHSSSHLLAPLAKENEGGTQLSSSKVA